TDAGSGVASPASNAVTVLTGASATLEEIDSIAEVAYFDGGIAQGLDATDIPVSLASTDADDGAVIEARYVEFSDWNAATPDVRGTEGTWQAIGTVSGGTISGATLNDVPLDLGTYKRIECRVQGSAAPESIMTRKVCVGLVVVGLGQSNAVKFAVADNSVTITPETIPEPNNVQLWTPDRTNTPRVGPTIKQINNEAGNEPMPGFARMVRLIQVNYPGLKILFGLMAVSGVQAPEWVDPDGTPPRPWEDDRRFVQDEITRHGTKIGVVWNMSWTAFMNQNAAIMVPILTQKLIDGTPVSLGTTIGEGGLAYTLNHSMAELVDYSYTKIGVIISTGRPAQSPTFTHTTVGEIMTTEAALAENIPGGWDPFFENTTDFPMALPKQWSPQTMCLRLAADDPHFSNDDDWGFPLLGELYAYQMLDMLGIVSVPTPEITDTDWTETHIDLWNPAYDITTRRNEEGGTSAFVRGFVFDGVAMTTEAQLLPNAGGSGRVGIRIAPSGGVDGSEPLFYGIGGIPGLLSSPADITARYIGDLPIMDLGLTGVPGMPIVARGQVSFESNLVGTPFFTLASGHGGFEDPASGGSGLDKVLTVEAVIRRTQSTDTGTFAQVLSNNFSWRMERSGILELGGGSQPNLPNVNFSDVFTFGKFVRVIISVDLNAGADGGTGGIIRAWHGEPGKVMTALTPTPVPSPGSISSTQPLRLLTPSLLADVRYINAWKQAITTDTVPDATTAYKRLYAGEGGTILTPSLPVWGSESVAS
ncbi:hypothetical protein, partial [Meridianimarinicoccus zhengii]|uniref:hypothetical protein n=1 Tax=Meridianimarinicoccus zhengii TaxID=2056810 RepID=UPI001C9B83D5